MLLFVRESTRRLHFTFILVTHICLTHRVYAFESIYHCHLDLYTCIDFPFGIHTHNKLMYGPCVCLCVYTFLGELIKMSVEALVKEAFPDCSRTELQRLLLRWIETLERGHQLASDFPKFLQQCRQRLPLYFCFQT
jgi:hypothetical protein